MAGDVARGAGSGVSGPPRLATWLLRRAPLARLDEIEADLRELFDRRAASSGLRHARRRYWRDVVSFHLHRRPRRGPDFYSTAEAGSMSALWFEWRQTLRAARREPAFFAIAAVTLAVGFAAQFAAFGVVDRLLLSPPRQVREADRVFRLHVERQDTDGGRFLWWQTPMRTYRDLRAGSPSVAGMAAYRTSRVSAGSGAGARPLTVTFADADYFPLLGITPSLGRFFGPNDDLPPQGSDVVVLSDAAWRSAYAADPAVVGRTERIGGRAFTIIGVAPPGFSGDAPAAVDAWAPLHAIANELPPTWATSFLYRSVNVLVRLVPAREPSALSAELGTAYQRTIAGTPAADPTARIVLGPLVPGRTTLGELTREARIALWLQGVAVLVFLVAIANVVNLQLSRLARQRRELAVRAALGAGWSRLLTRLVVETLLVTATGAVAGTLLASWSATLVQQLLLPDVPGAIQPARFSAAALLTALAATAIVAGFGALQLRGEGIGARLKSGRGGDGFSRARLRHGLLVAQVVMSALLLVGAGLFLRSMRNLDRLQFGIDTDRVLVVSIPLASSGETAAAIESFYERALDALAAAPGVEAVSAAQSTPFAPSQRLEMSVPGFDIFPLARNYPTFYTVTPDHFETMGMRILRGRGFTEADRQGAEPVIVVEAALGDALWPGLDPIGRCIRIGAGQPPCRTIVGVTTNTRRFVATPDAALRFYVPIAQRITQMTPQALLVRVAGDPSARIEDVRRTLLGVADNLPYAQIRVLNQLAQPEMRPWRLGSTLFVVFGAAALLVATAGVYALFSVIVAQRTREIGVRLALGASPSRTRAMILRQSLTWVAVGLAAGLAIASMAGRFVRPLLFEASPYDAAVYAGTALLLLAVAAAATFVPAVRASRVDPTVALRAD